MPFFSYFGAFRVTFPFGMYQRFEFPIRFSELENTNPPRRKLVARQWGEKQKQKKQKKNNGNHLSASFRVCLSNNVLKCYVCVPLPSIGKETPITD